MSVFAGYASDIDQPLASTYTSTSYQIDIGCGPTFVNTTVAVATMGAASGVRSAGMGLLSAVGAAAVVLMI